ncbi:MAG: prephenate dehydratase [Oscillospiraceae bacterium]|nr:prephenate dehydratase [Oscillospiraceae bacterium]
MKEQLEQVRQKINETDRLLVRLFSQRMELVAQVAQIKEAAGLPVYDPKREAQILETVSQTAETEKSPYLRRIYQCLMDASKDYERALMETPDFSQKTESTFPARPKVACQGVPGAFSGEASRLMFPNGEQVFVPSWEDAFQKVSQGECDFAVLPVENSLAGSVGQVYDLLLRYRLTISRACRLAVEQNLLAMPGATMDDITEIYSHPQGLAQCKNFCAGLPLARSIPMENTAAAAKMVAALGDIHKAAIASSYCADLYGLQILAPNIQTAKHNTTRFVAVSREYYHMEYANKISLVFSLPHQPGSLNQLLSRFAALDLNLTKIESRPVSGKNFEYYFYLDFAGNASSPLIRQLIDTLSQELPAFTFLGNYQEL